MVVPFISQASDGWELRVSSANSFCGVYTDILRLPQVLVEYFCQFRRLQNLELQRTAIKPVFPHRGQELRNILSSVVLDYGKQCKMLTSFKLGGFTFTRDNLERDLVMERYNPTDATMPIPNIWISSQLLIYFFEWPICTFPQSKANVEGASERKSKFLPRPLLPPGIQIQLLEGPRNNQTRES